MIAGTFNSRCSFLRDNPASILIHPRQIPTDGLIKIRGLTEKSIMLERGQGAGEVTETIITALTYQQTGGSPSQYEWILRKYRCCDRERRAARQAYSAVVTVIGSGRYRSLRSKTQQTMSPRPLAIKVKVREEGFQMLRHAVTSIGTMVCGCHFPGSKNI